MKPKQTRREVYQSHQPGVFPLDIHGIACELLAYFLADEPIQKLISKHRFPGISAWYNGFRQQRAIHLLIEIAAAYRMTSWRLSPEQKQAESKKSVGILFEGDSDDHVDLSMHEACNKIIHAEDLFFETRKVRNAPHAYVKEQIQTFGTKRAKEWHACIWIPEFCDAALTIPAAADPCDDERPGTSLTL